MAGFGAAAAGLRPEVSGLRPTGLPGSPVGGDSVRVLGLGSMFSGLRVSGGSLSVLAGSTFQDFRCQVACGRRDGRSQTTSVSRTTDVSDESRLVRAKHQGTGSIRGSGGRFRKRGQTMLFGPRITRRARMGGRGSVGRAGSG